MKANFKKILGFIALNILLITNCLAMSSNPTITEINDQLNELQGQRQKNIKAIAEIYKEVVTNRQDQEVRDRAMDLIIGESPQGKTAEQIGSTLTAFLKAVIGEGAYDTKALIEYKIKIDIQTAAIKVVAAQETAQDKIKMAKKFIEAFKKARTELTKTMDEESVPTADDFIRTLKEDFTKKPNTENLKALKEAYPDALTQEEFDKAMIKAFIQENKIQDLKEFLKPMIETFIKTGDIKGLNKLIETLNAEAENDFEAKNALKDAFRKTIETMLDTVINDLGGNTSEEAGSKAFKRIKQIKEAIDASNLESTTAIEQALQLALNKVTTQTELLPGPEKDKLNEIANDLADPDKFTETRWDSIMEGFRFLKRKWYSKHYKKLNADVKEITDSLTVGKEENNIETFKDEIKTFVRSYKEKPEAVAELLKGINAKRGMSWPEKVKCLKNVLDIIMEGKTADEQHKILTEIRKYIKFKKDRDGTGNTAIEEAFRSASVKTNVIDGLLGGGKTETEKQKEAAAKAAEAKAHEQGKEAGQESQEERDASGTTISTGTEKQGGKKPAPANNNKGGDGPNGDSQTRSDDGVHETTGGQNGATPTEVQQKKEEARQKAGQDGDGGDGNGEGAEVAAE